MPGLRDAVLRHATHFIQLAERVRTLYVQGGAVATRGLAEFDVEQQNIIAAFNGLLKYDPYGQPLIKLVDAVMQGAFIRIHPNLRQSWIEAQLRVYRSIKDLRGECDALANLGEISRQTADVHRAIKYFEEALAIGQDLGDRRRIGVIQSSLGIAYAQLSGAGDLKRSAEYFEKAFPILREFGLQHDLEGV